MQVKAKLNNLRITPKKVRLVASLVRGKKVNVALDNLKFLNKKAAKPVADLIRSAVANAEHNFKLNRDNLLIKEIRVDKGLTLKRYMPRAHGRATMLRKTMSKITVVLAEIKPTKEKSATKPKKVPAVKLESKEQIHEKKVVSKEGVKEDIATKVKGKDVEKEKGVEIKDPRREGKHRHKQHVDKTTLKEKGGVVKKTANKKKAG